MQGTDIPPDPVARLVEFQDYQQFTEQRVYPSAFRVARLSTGIFAALFVLDASLHLGTPLFLPILAFNLPGLFFVGLMTAAIGLPRFHKHRQAWILGAGLCSQVLVVTLNSLVMNRFMLVPFIVLFYLFGVLILSPALQPRLYIGSAVCTALYVALLLVLGKSPVEESFRIGLIILPALGFLGYAIHSQRKAAKDLWLMAFHCHVNATIDSLSQLLNRRAWYEQCNRRVESGPEISFIMLDIDHFKQINDTWGHDCGDVVIKRVAETLLLCTRSSDITGRLGGEEFGIFLPGTSLDTARQLAERIRQTIESLNIVYQDQSIRVTVSLGVSSAYSISNNLEHLVKQGDECLYKAKHAGRNCIMSNPCNE